MNEHAKPSPTPEQQMTRLSRRSFMWAGASLLGAYGVLRWINTSASVDGVAAPLRKALEFNDAVAAKLYSPERLSPEFDKSQITELKVNGTDGIESELGDWDLQTPGGTAVTLAQIKALPKTEMIAEHKCVEGWSAIVQWGGTRFSEFAKLQPPPPKAAHVALVTPDGQYYVSVDLPAMMHPQTLLCYEMNGQPLTEEHGGPLRLVLPHKYGVKSLKRIGSIAYSEKPAADFWAEQGYDNYIGL